MVYKELLFLYFFYNSHGVEILGIINIVPKRKKKSVCRDSLLNEETCKDVSKQTQTQTKIPK